MATSIIVSYLALGLLAGFAGMVLNGPIGFRLTGQPLDRLTAIAGFKRRFKGGFQSRLQWVGYKLLPGLVFVGAWPVFAFIVPKFAKADGHRQFMGAASLAPISILVSLSFAAFAWLLVALQGLGAARWAVDAGCVVLLIGLLADQISNTVSVTDFPAILRRSLMRPYLQFVIMIALQYLTLLAVALLLTHLRVGGQLSLDAVIGEIGDLAVFSHFFVAISTATISPLDILLTLAGVTFFAMIGRLLLQYRQFVRQPADHAYVLANLVKMAKFDSARRWLDSLDSGTRNDSALLQPKILLLLGENDYETAYRLAVALFGLNGSDGETVIFSTATVDDILCHLVGMSRLIDLEPAQYRQIISFACTRDISDGGLSVDLPAMVLGHLDVHRSVEVDRLGISSEKYPISHSFSCWALTDVSSEEDDARLKLRSFVPARQTDRIVQLIVDCRMRRYHKEGFSDRLNEVLDLVACSGQLPGWLRWFLTIELGDLGESKTLDRESKARAKRCEMAQLEGANENEAELCRAVKRARRSLAQ